MSAPRKQTNPDKIGEGHYARKQLAGPNPLISWSHRRRFSLALELARPFAGGRLLDYGCGDGTFLALLANTNLAPAVGIGAEVGTDLIEDCRTRHAQIPNLAFVSVKDLTGPAHVGQYDAIFCMEVLEHVVEPNSVLSHLSQLLAPGGRLVISVPVEIGPALLIKQLGRRVAAWRGCRDYPGSTPYTTGELIRSVFAGAAQHVARPVHPNPNGAPFHDHKGFNWRWLQRQVERHFVVESTQASPLRWLPLMFSSQAWFIALAFDSHS